MAVHICVLERAHQEQERSRSQWRTVNQIYYKIQSKGMMSVSQMEQ